MRLCFLIVMPLVLVAGCVLPLDTPDELTNGELPGEPTELTKGHIAVDNRDERVFLINTFNDSDSGETKSLLRCVDPDAAGVSPLINPGFSEVADLTTADEANILFPESGLLIGSQVLVEHSYTEALVLLDKQTFEITQDNKLIGGARVHYLVHSTLGMSQSRRWIGGASHTSEKPFSYVIDTKSLESREVPHDGDEAQTVWKNTTDELVAIVSHAADAKTQGSKPHVRILSWSLEDLVAADWSTDDEGFWSNRIIDIDASGVNFNTLIYPQTIAISPDDKWGAFVVREPSSDDPPPWELLVVEMATGKVRVIPDAKGPIGFTPDSSTIVAFDDNGSQTSDIPYNETDQRLLLIDVNTLKIRAEDVDIPGRLVAYISPEGRFIVLASPYNSYKLIVYDLAAKSWTTVDGPALTLEEFASRPGKDELWLVNDGKLFKLDMKKAELTEIKLNYVVGLLNILPERDTLVLSELYPLSTLAMRLHFVNLPTMDDAIIDLPRHVMK